MTLAPTIPTTWVRPSVPASGSTLGAATEKRAIHVRAAVETVRRSFGEGTTVAAAWADNLASRWREEPHALSDAPALQAAWALVAMRIVGRSVGALSGDASIRDAETWFLGSACSPSLLSNGVDEFADHEAARALESFAYDEDLRDLLPYVLEAHGPGSRASVLRDPCTQKSRRAKRAGGVFYTPSDVAEYIVREALGELGQPGGHANVLDPACGSGVFLKAVLDLALAQTPRLDPFDFVERRLHGIDVNPLAIEAACFVLLHQCLVADPGLRENSPWSLWHRIRCNLIVADALTFHVAGPSEEGGDALAALRASLGTRYVGPSVHPLDTGVDTLLFSQGLAMGSVFPALAEGADVIVGNPPYATIGSRDDARALAQRFVSLSDGNVSKSDYFPVFVEMMWRLARPGRNSSGLVVPLSLACSSRAQMVATRRGIMSSGGRWRFAFFDREPHALFGEDVKTRNAIVFRDECGKRAGSAATVETGPLRKWTSRQRAQLFGAIGFTPIAGSIAGGIPKLAGAEPAQVFSRLARQTSTLRELCASVGSCLPENAGACSADARVFVAGTAYNFLNVFRPHRQLPPQRAPWSSSRLIALAFTREAQASRAFAVLSSRVAYWLWHANGDGFHVTRAFVMSLPYHDRLLGESERDALACLGTRLWEDIQSQQIVSINGGRQTVAYRPHACEGIRDEIDTLVLGALGVSPTFIEYLRTFTRNVVSVDEDEEARRRFTSHFSEGGRQCPE